MNSVRMERADRACMETPQQLLEIFFGCAREIRAFEPMKFISIGDDGGAIRDTANTSEARGRGRIAGGFRAWGTQDAEYLRDWDWRGSRP